MSKYLIIGLVFAVLCGLYIHLYPVPRFPLDDAYITLHNAMVLAGGKEVNYVGVPALAGTTSVVHTVLVAALTFLLRPEWALMAASWLGILLYALAATYLASVHKLSKWATAILLFVAIASGETIFQLLNGVETGLAMAALTLALALASRPQPSRYLPVLCGILPFLRPELIAVSALLLANQVRLRWQSKERRRDVALDVASACGVGLVWLVMLFANTGHWYPETIDAKRFFFAESVLPAGERATLVFRASKNFSATIGFPLALCVAFTFFTAAGRLALVFAGVFLTAYFVQFPGALWHNDQRYPYLLLPIMLLGAAIGLSRSDQIAPKAATWLLAISAFQGIVTLPARWQLKQEGLRAVAVEEASTASFCNQHFPRGSKILLHDAGYLSYATQFQLIDLVGLKTPSSVAVHRRLTYPTGGRSRAVAISEIAERSHPDFLIVVADWERVFHIASGLHEKGWNVEPIGPMQSENGLHHYLIFRLSRQPQPPPWMALGIGNREANFTTW